MKPLRGGAFIAMGVPGDTVDAQTRRMIRRIQPGGFILFARNIKSASQVRALTDELRSLVPYEPIITLDEEGGRVSRLKPLLLNKPPAVSDLSKHGDLRLIERHGQITGRMLRLLGFNLNLAPVLDMHVEGTTTTSLHSRTFGSEPKSVIAGARSFVRGMRKHGILNCGKHFPGYTHAAVDPHVGLPIVTRTADELRELEWKPFKELLPVLDSVMTAHVRFPAVDSGEHPASLSPHLVQRVLRESMQYQRCVITDDLDMGAVTGAYDAVASAQLAMRAGNDLLLVCHNFDALESIAIALGKLPRAIKEPSRQRILALRSRLVKPRTLSQSAFSRINRDFGDLNEQIS